MCSGTEMNSVHRTLTDYGLNWLCNYNFVLKSSKMFIDPFKSTVTEHNPVMCVLIYVESLPVH